MSGVVLHLSRLLADTLLPAGHALLDRLINREVRFLMRMDFHHYCLYGPYCKQSKHSTVVDSYDVEIVTVRDLGLTKVLQPFLWAVLYLPAFHVMGDVYTFERCSGLKLLRGQK